MIIATARPDLATSGDVVDSGATVWTNATSAIALSSYPQASLTSSSAKSNGAKVKEQVASFEFFLYDASGNVLSDYTIYVETNISGVS